MARQIGPLGLATLWCAGKIEKKKLQNRQCKEVSRDPKFDEAVKKAVHEVGVRFYNIAAYPLTNAHLLGARNCQTWVDYVLDRADDIYSRGK